MKNIKNKLLQQTANILVTMAPSIATKSACYALWGEPKCPKCLKG